MCIIYLYSFIQRCISNNKNEFQLLLLEVLHIDVVQKMKTMKVDNNFKSALKESIKQLKNLELCAVVSNQQTFCWAILSACCSRVKVSSENSAWAEHYYNDRLDLGAVFSVYCKEKKLTDDECIIITELPDEEMASHPCKDLCR